MTTFTRTPGAKTATIDVSSVKRISKIDDNIYGGFLEYVLHFTFSQIDSRQPVRAWKDCMLWYSYHTELYESYASPFHLTCGSSRCLGMGSK